MKKYCMDCGKMLIGRSDKKFCDDHCRSHYNNELNKDDNTFLRKINKILKKNKTILRKFHTEGTLSLTRSPLIAAGFDFDHFTHQQRDHKGQTYICCYEYGYLELNEKEMLLRRHDELSNPEIEKAS